MRKKILITTFTFPPNKDGVACATNALARDLASYGYEIVVCTDKQQQRENQNPHDGIRIEEFALNSAWQFDGQMLEEKLRMRDFIIAENPDVIICQCWDTWATLIAEETFVSLPRTRKVLFSHGYSTIWKPTIRFPWGIKGLLRGLMKLCRLPKTISKYDRIVFLEKKHDLGRFIDHTIAKFIRYPSISIIPNSFDIPETKHESPSFNSWDRDHELVVMCVSNYLPGKNQELALRAFRRAAIPDSVLVFIGSSYNDYSRHLMEIDSELSKKSSRERVVFIEKFSRAETLAAYLTADIFLLTSKSETGPLVVLEALACGVPFISTRVGIVDQIPGGIVAKGERRLAEALSFLASNRNTRISLGYQGRDVILNRYDRSKIRECRIRMIRELLEQQ